MHGRPALDMPYTPQQPPPPRRRILPEAVEEGGPCGSLAEHEIYPVHRGLRCHVRLSFGLLLALI